MQAEERRLRGRNVRSEANFVRHRPKSELARTLVWRDCRGSGGNATRPKARGAISRPTLANPKNSPLKTTHLSPRNRYTMHQPTEQLTSPNEQLPYPVLHTLQIEISSVAYLRRIYYATSAHIIALSRRRTPGCANGANHPPGRGRTAKSQGAAPPKERRSLC